MAAAVRLFTHSGLVTAHVLPGSSRYSTDSVGLIKYPYIDNETITANTSTAQSSSSSIAPDGTKLIQVQVQEGLAVHIEINPPNRSVTATTDSPIIRGDVTFNFGENWTVSLLEHTVV